ncbi:mediator of RNA polymerase II transcription subunit 6, putative [Plasmodium sp. gorilla clade G1]|nr:mediator of RNA polymerase II transcription subunit 6, putative [Plasmodium sp. gorilla clade G1]
MGDINYYESRLRKDNKIEYVDNIFLSKYMLNNIENAMQYFYTCPFYTSRSKMCLNEKIRTGKIINDDDEGYIFNITYDNLNILKENEPSDFVSKHIYYNTNSIFHVSLRQKYRLNNVNCTKVIQYFCIVNGKIYSTLSFGELLTNKINNIVRNINNLFDSVNNMTNFNISSNYYFKSKDEEYTDGLNEKHKLNDMYITTRKRKKR